MLLSECIARVDPAAARTARAIYCEPFARALHAVWPGPAVQALARPVAPPDGAVVCRFSAPAASACVAISGPATVAFELARAASRWSSRARVDFLLAWAMGACPALAEWLDAMGLKLTEVGDMGAWPSGRPADWTLRRGAHQLFGWLDGELDRAAERAGTRSGPSALAGLPWRNRRVPARIAFGPRRMSAGSLSRLRQGDVVLTQVAAIDVTGIDDAWLLVGSRSAPPRGWRCSVKGRQACLASEKLMGEEELAEAGLGSASAPDAPGSMEALAALELDVRMELQPVALPLSVLAEIHAGYVIELPIPAECAHVDLIVAGQVFGRAELVVVGGRLGARMLEVRRE